jgi:Rod binding domain-containing protein
MSFGIPATAALKAPDAREVGSETLEAGQIKEMSRDFEALLLRQILQESRKSIIKGGLFEESSSADIYNDMVDFHLADSISRSSSLGLAGSLERELTRQNARPAQPVKEPHAS